MSRRLISLLRRPLVAATAALTLISCAPQASGVAERRVVPTMQLPAMKTFGHTRTEGSVRPNAQIAADFLELSFKMESGRALPRLTRFEGPVTIGVRGAAPASLTGDLTRLVSRFRNEAGLDIRFASAGETPNIVVQVLSRKELQRYVPQAACFVVPRVSSWAEFKADRRGQIVDWTTLERRERAAVFLPGDVSPQETRDCLHEEIAQALGPLNDLYRLPESVFNDDNFHTVLTGFDMLILKAYYDPALANGMSREQVAARLPAILARLNPAGNRPVGRLESETPREWTEQIERAVGPRTSPRARSAAAKRAVAIADANRWTDSRRAYSLYALGRLSLNSEPELALAAFLESSAIYRSRPETAIQAAHVAMQLAAYSLSAGRPDTAIEMVDESLPAVAAAENAALLSTLMLIKAEALDAKGQAARAAALRSDALGWARYGFGPDGEVRARLLEISTLNPGEPLTVRGPQG
ncbi:DUF2927 domain-containing protein [Tropicimonas sp. IMCC34011]|uniref:DUF2927 domain-containing protein n=1 Tax=Tropicimonas sp. IMCC34011 TaxID=2248759 RepID=UPI001E4DDAA4|nr:DUF2927 domain-containing protein [Tropicimonas sp. IMCC34011]